MATPTHDGAGLGSQKARERSAEVNHLGGSPIRMHAPASSRHKDPGGAGRFQKKSAWVARFLAELLAVAKSCTRARRHLSMPAARKFRRLCGRTASSARRLGEPTALRSRWLSTRRVSRSRSMISRPAAMSHAASPRGTCRQRNLGPYRISIGLEAPRFIEISIPRFKQIRDALRGEGRGHRPDPRGLGSANAAAHESRARAAAPTTNANSTRITRVRVGARSAIRQL